MNGTGPPGGLILHIKGEFHPCDRLNACACKLLGKFKRTEQIIRVR